MGLLNAFTAGNQFLGTKSVGVSMERGFGVLKGLRFLKDGAP